MKRTMPIVLLCVGGASGVGKTTVLDGLFTRWSVPTHYLSTGTYFRDALSIQARDDIRKSEWPDVEATVADQISRDIIEAGGKHDLIVIDTHFGAKTARGTYRIGLLAPLIAQIGCAARTAAAEADRPLSTRVVLVDADVNELLARRRNDKSRVRELDARDCYASLRENRRMSAEYFVALHTTDREEDRILARLDNHLVSDTVDRLLALLREDNTGDWVHVDG